MKQGLYIHVEDALEIFRQSPEDLLQELNEHASIYITETDNIIRRISES